MPAVKEKAGLTGNRLKIIAMVTMTCDHVGLELLPRLGILRIIGRLALPVYAYMIAEGCVHTHDRRRYFLRLLALGFLCQIVYYAAMGSLYQCILITFSLSAAVIFLTAWGTEGGWLRAAGAFAAGTAGAYFLCEVLPGLLPGTDFAIDYGFLGVMLPVAVWLGRTRGEKLLLLTAVLALLALRFGGNQWFALGAVPLLALYNGRRGKYSIGRLFYIYYPLHLAVIYGISLLL